VFCTSAILFVISAMFVEGYLLSLYAWHPSNIRRLLVLLRNFRLSSTARIIPAKPIP